MGLIVLQSGFFTVLLKNGLPSSMTTSSRNYARRKSNKIWLKITRILSPFGVCINNINKWLLMRNWKEILWTLFLFIPCHDCIHPRGSQPPHEKWRCCFVLMIFVMRIGEDALESVCRISNGNVTGIVHPAQLACNARSVLSLIGLNGLIGRWQWKREWGDSNARWPEVLRRTQKEEACWWCSFAVVSDPLLVKNCE